MEPLEPTVSQTTFNQPTGTTGLFGTKIPSSIAFAVAVLLFLLPFIDIKCNNMSLMKVSGVKLATGFDIKTPGSSNSLFGDLSNLSEATQNNNSSNKKEGNIWAMMALGLGIGGFILSIINKKISATGGLLTGSLSAIAMIILFITIKNDISKEAGMKPDISATQGLENTTNPFSENTLIAVEFAPAFYIALLSFLLAAWFSYKRKKYIGQSGAAM